MMLLSILFLYFYLCNSLQTIKLNTTNHVVLSGTIDEELSSKFIYNFNLLQKKNNSFVYINSPGGSVIDGMKIFHEIQKYNMTCIAETAYSMGFIIFQACNNRYILPNGKLMQHQMSLYISDQKSRIENYMNFIEQVEESVISNQLKKINISISEYKEKINNDWWLYGNMAVKENCADDIVNIECTETLTKKTEIIDKNGYKYTYSSCPLVSSHIKKEKLNNGDDYFPFHFL